jgi:hypothetical protein
MLSGHDLCASEVRLSMNFRLETWANIVVFPCWLHVSYTFPTLSICLVGCSVT